MSSLVLFQNRQKRYLRIHFFPPLTSSNRHNPHPPQKPPLILLPQRGGEGNVHREKGSQMHEGLADKLKHKMFGKKEEK